MKRAIVLLLVVVMVFYTFSLSAFAAEQSGSYTFSGISGTYTAKLVRSGSVTPSFKFSMGGCPLSASGTAQKEHNPSGSLYTTSIYIDSVSSCIANKWYSKSFSAGTNYQFLWAKCSYRLNYYTVVNDLQA